MKGINPKIYNLIFSRENFSVPRGLRLELNQILEAQVMDATNTSAKLMIRGKNLSCRSNVILHPGDNIRLQVKEITADTIIMQLISKSFKFEEEHENIKELLRNLGFLPNKENLEIVRNLMKFNLLINRENIENIQNLLSILNSTSPNTINYITYLYSLGLTYLIKLTHQSFSVFSSPFNLTFKNLIDNILNILNKGPLNSKEEQIVNYIREMISSLTLTTTQSRDLEEELKFYLFPDSKKFLLQFSAIQAFDKLKEFYSSNLRELISSLLKVSISIYQQQLIAAASLKSSQNPVLNFQIPWYFDEKWNNLQLKIIPEKKGKRIDPDFLTIVFLIELSHLRCLKIILQIYGRKMGLQIFTENKRIQTFLEENIEELKINLEGLNYQLTDVECKVSENLSYEVKATNQIDIRNIKEKVDVKA